MAGILASGICSIEEKGGRLIIEARKVAVSERADHGGQRYGSARSISNGKAEWTHSFVGVRAKLPCRKGSWPAIWMLGATVGLPDGGEIEIIKYVGNIDRALRDAPGLLNHPWTGPMDRTASLQWCRIA